MWLDLLISAPVTLVLVGLYWRCGPVGRAKRRVRFDAVVMLFALLSMVLIIVLGHAWIEYPGMGLNVMLVAAAYLSVLIVLGVGAWLRWNAGRDRVAAMARSASADLESRRRP